MPIKLEEAGGEYDLSDVLLTFEKLGFYLKPLSSPLNPNAKNFLNNNILGLA